jgi:hypothetical protein
MSLKLIRHIWLSVSAVGAMFLLVSLTSSANAQTQASCQFSQTFSVYFSVGNANRSLTPRNVNDYGTVVGDGYDDTNFIEMGFFHWPDGNYTYNQRSSNGQPVQTFLYDRNDASTTVGITLPGKTPMPFMLKGSTYTPLTMTISGTTFNSFYPFGSTDGARL